MFEFLISVVVIMVSGALMYWLGLRDGRRLERARQDLSLRAGQEQKQHAEVSWRHGWR